MNDFDGVERRVRTSQSMSEMRVRQMHEWFSALDACLEDGEVAKYICAATRDNLPGLLAVTDSRLLWVTRKIRSAIGLESVSGLSSEQGAFRASVSQLTVEYQGGKHQFTDIESACAQDVVSLLGGTGSNAVALAVTEVPVPAPKPVEPMGGVGLITTVAVFVVGGFAAFPWLRDIDTQSPLIWPFAALGLFFVAVLLGQFADSMTRALADGLRRGKPEKG